MEKLIEISQHYQDGLINWEEAKVKVVMFLADCNDEAVFRELMETIQEAS